MIVGFTESTTRVRGADGEARTGAVLTAAFAFSEPTVGGDAQYAELK